MSRFDEKVAIVTGCGRDIGWAITGRVAPEGSSVRSNVLDRTGFAIQTPSWEASGEGASSRTGATSDDLGGDN